MSIGFCWLRRDDNLFHWCANLAHILEDIEDAPLLLEMATRCVLPAAEHTPEYLLCSGERALCIDHPFGPTDRGQVNAGRHPVFWTGESQFATLQSSISAT